MRGLLIVGACLLAGVVAAQSLMVNNGVSKTSGGGNDYCTQAISESFSTDSGLWDEDNGDWTVSSNRFQVDATANAIARHTTITGTTGWACVELYGVGLSGGVTLRHPETIVAATTEFYVVHWNETNDETWWSVCTTSSCTNIQLFTSGTIDFDASDELCARVDGTGAATVVTIWKNPVGADPDDWGAADVTTSTDPTSYCTSGTCPDDAPYCGLYNQDGLGVTGEFDRFTAGPC